MVKTFNVKFINNNYLEKETTVVVEIVEDYGEYKVIGSTIELKFVDSSTLLEGVDLAAVKVLCENKLKAIGLI